MFGLSVAIFLLAVFVYVPGYFGMRAFSGSRIISFGFAPLISTALYVLAGIVLYQLGLFASWRLVVFPVFALCVCAFLLSVVLRGGSVWPLSRKGRQQEARCSGEQGDKGSVVRVPVLRAVKAFSCEIDLRLLLFAVLFNLLIGAVVYLGTLSGPDSFSQNYDTAHHLSHIAATVEYGNWSTLNVAMDGEGPGVFYPSVLHIYAALLVGSLGVSTGCAINAVVFLLVSFTMPIGVFFLGSSLFSGRRLAGLCCCLLCLAFPALPWTLIRFSALLANVVGLAFLPLVLTAFVACFQCGLPWSKRVLRALLCLIGFFAISVAHPNTLFTAVVFLMPFCAQQVWNLFDGYAPPMKGRKVAGCVAVLLFLLLCAFIWKSIHGLDYFRSIVEFEYRSFSTVPQAILDVLLVKFRWFSPNIPLALLVLCGIVAALRSSGLRWLVATYLFAAVQLVVCTSLEPSVLKSLLCGFWYNHDFRLMASFSICALPLAGLGLASFAEWAELSPGRSRSPTGLGLASFAEWAERAVRCRSVFPGRLGDQRLSASQEASALPSEGKCESGLFQRLGAFSVRLTGVPGASVAAIGVAVVLVCFPVGFSVSEGFQTRSLGQAMAKLYAINDWDGGKAIYTSDEREFVQKAVQVLPEDAVVMNFPYDGSSYSYGLDGLNTFFRTNVTAAQHDAEYIVETRLADFARDPEVRAAARELGITHVIQLDHGLGKGSTTLEREYHAEKWAGISSIDGDTEGFEEVLAEGDLRLDRIEY